MMAALVVVAIDCVAVRALVAEGRFSGFVLPGLVEQAGLVALLLSRGRVRTFWVGFVVFSVVAELAYWFTVGISGKPLAPLYRAYLSWILEHAFAPPFRVFVRGAALNAAT